MCQLVQPWGCRGLAFPKINIKRDSHLEPRPVLLRFGFIYLGVFFLCDFSLVLFFLYPSAFSYQCVIKPTFDRETVIYHTCSFAQPYMILEGLGYREIQSSGVNYICSVWRADTTHGSV